MHTGDMFAVEGRADPRRATTAAAASNRRRRSARRSTTVKNVDTVIVGHSPLRTVPELQEYQQFMTDFVAAVRQAKKAGKSVDEAAASINLNDKYQGVRQPAVQSGDPSRL